MFLHDNDDSQTNASDDKQHVTDTVGGIVDGIQHGDAAKVGDEVERDIEQTKDDVQDVVRGEDGNDS